MRPSRYPFRRFCDSSVANGIYHGDIVEQMTTIHLSRSSVILRILKRQIYMIISAVLERFVILVNKDLTVLRGPVSKEHQDPVSY